MSNNFDPNTNYIFTDKDGNTFITKGDNPLVKEAITKGLPISINDRGERYIYPYIERDGDGVIAHMPEWFKKTEQYKEWREVWVPTIPNTKIDDYVVSVMNKTLNHLSEEVVSNLSTSSNTTETAKTNSTAIQTIDQPIKQQTNMTTLINPIVSSMLFIVAIIVAGAFARNVKSKIKQKQEFSGLGWGFVNGIIGVGIIFVVFAHSSINKELEKVRSKKYKKYAKNQMQQFTITYSILVIIWIVISIIIATRPII